MKTTYRRYFGHRIEIQYDSSLECSERKTKDELFKLEIKDKIKKYDILKII